MPKGGICDIWDIGAVIGYGTCIAIGSWLLRTRITMLATGDFTMATVFGIGLGVALLVNSGIGLYSGGFLRKQAGKVEGAGVKISTG